MRPRCSGSDLGTHSATPLSGTSTLKHAITVKSGVFCSPERCCETGTTSGCIPCGGVQPCLICGRNTLALNPQPEQNLFLALPYLPSILPFFWFLPPTYSLTATAEKKAGGERIATFSRRLFCLMTLNLLTKTPAAPGWDLIIFRLWRHQVERSLKPFLFHSKTVSK